jgi:hypothetical protein
MENNLIYAETIQCQQIIFIVKIPCPKSEYSSPFISESSKKIPHFFFHTKISSFF